MFFAMKKVDEKLLREIASQLLLDLSDEEYQKMVSDINVFVEQMSLVSSVQNVDDVEPCYFPYPILNFDMREDDNPEVISQEEVLSNVNETVDGMIKIPKVVKK